MQVFARLGEVLAALQGSRIEVMALKGAALAELVYGQIGLRTMGDVDLLVRKSDLPRVEAILEGMEFQVDESYRTREWYETQHHHIVPYATRDGVLKLDIHHDITTVRSRIRVPVESLWADARTVRIASRPCLTLSWEHMLLHLALHMADQNRFLGDLRGLCDVAEIVKRCPSCIDWDELVRIARAWGAATQVFFALSVARKAVGAAVPFDVIRQIRRDVSLLPFEESLLRLLCVRASLIFDSSQHVVYDWILLDLAGGLLSKQSRVRVVRDVTSVVVRRFRSRLA
jgi:hypothetical protein